MTLRTITEQQIRAHLTTKDAVAALEAALKGDVDPAADGAPDVHRVSAGEVLTIASEVSGHVGVNVLTDAPGNPSRGLERSQGLFLLLNAETLEPEAAVNARQLNRVRTAAVSALAAKHLAPRTIRRMVIFGSGPQARTHIQALLDTFESIDDVVIIGRDGYKAEGVAAYVIERGIQARIGHAVPTKQAVSEADLIVCATNASEPLLEAEWVRDTATIIAIGSYLPDSREVPGSLMGRSQVFVEDHAAAMREAGDVVLAVKEGEIAEADLVGLRALVRDEVRVDRTRPRVFKSVGQAWEDVVIATTIERAVPTTRPASNRQGAPGTDSVPVVR